VHRACVDCAFGHNGRVSLSGVPKILHWFGFELRKTAARTEIISSAFVLVPVFRRVRVHEHSANGITHVLYFLFAIGRVVVTAVTALMRFR
jgi:hypothetical protein